MAEPIAQSPAALNRRRRRLALNFGRLHLKERLFSERRTCKLPEKPFPDAIFWLAGKSKAVYFMTGVGQEKRQYSLWTGRLRTKHCACIFCVGDNTDEKTITFSTSRIWPGGKWLRWRKRCGKRGAGKPDRSSIRRAKRAASRQFSRQAGAQPGGRELFGARYRRIAPGHDA
ncbi:MAG: hypothetical protein R3C51_11890 [Parvularculaceae bacterium]